MNGGTIVKWLKQVGDRVEQGEPLVEIENAKAVNTLEAPVAGMVTQIVASSEDTIGTDGGVKYSTKTPKTLWTFQRGREQSWQRTDLGFHGLFPTITGAIFEPGFPDCFLQMWAAFLAERGGVLGDGFGCVTPEEAVRSHELFAAALQSHAEKRAIEVPDP